MSGRKCFWSAQQLETEIVLGDVAAGCFQSFHKCLTPGTGQEEDGDGGEWGMGVRLTGVSVGV